MEKKIIRFERYQNRHYQKVCDFLIEINQENSNHFNWNWARFEWMHDHPLTKKESLGYMGLWFDDDHLIGAAVLDMYFGEAFVGVLSEYKYLYPEILKYAFDNLKDDQGLGVTFEDSNIEEIKEALKQEFYKEEADEELCEIGLEKEFPIQLPNGFSIGEYDPYENQEESEWLFWQGFDHGDDKEEFLKNFEKSTSKRAHFNKFLCIVVRNQEGEPVASASTWYDERVDYAYLEPVCVIPAYRKMGIGKAAVYLAINHARALGAKRAIVTSDQPFYKHIGFALTHHFSFYWKK